jgi:hypothetical protein
MYRQGDVLLVPMSEDEYRKIMASVSSRRFGPSEPQNRMNVILAEGEATGHHHVLEGDTAVMDKDGRPWVVAVVQPTVLTHQEHDAIEIPPGHYEVVRQEEYTPRGSRMVWD